MKSMSVSVIVISEFEPLYISTRMMRKDMERANMMIDVTERMMEWSRRKLSWYRLMVARPPPMMRGTNTRTRATIGKAYIVLVKAGLRFTEESVFERMISRITTMRVNAASMAPITMLPIS